MLLVYFVVLIFSFIVTFGFLKVLIPRLKAAGITGKDMNKPDKPEIAEMGGIAIIAGFTASIMLVIMLNTFFGFEINLKHLLAGLIVVHSIAFIGIVDDLISIPQYVKAILPIFAAVPLIALRAAGSTTMALPFVGEVDFGLFYLLVLVPIGITVASNLTNMLAGFNGLEAGMGIIIFSVASILAYHNNATVSFFLFLSFLGALIAFFLFNRYPAKVFPGDVGTLSIGATLATGVIIGNMETIGALLLLPHVVDFFIKLANNLPKWGEEYKGGKLYPVGGKVRGFCQLVMKLTNGISEQNLVLVFLAIEALVGIIVLLLFLH